MSSISAAHNHALALPQPNAANKSAAISAAFDPDAWVKQAGKAASSVPNSAAATQPSPSVQSILLQLQGGSPNAAGAQLAGVTGHHQHGAHGLHKGIASLADSGASLTQPSADASGSSSTTA